MKLADLIKNTSWSSVKLTLNRSFPLDEEKWTYFKTLFDDLKYNIIPSESDISICISKEIDPVDGEIHFQMSGLNLGPGKTRREYEKFLELEFTTWNKWLGMNIDDSTLEDLSSVEIIGACMYMMTFIRMKPETILNQVEKFIESGNDDEKILKEENIGDLISYNDLKGYFSLS